MMSAMEFFVGTSGWAYPWNEEGSLEWYAKSGLNALELNFSFYRFPSPNAISSWNQKGRDLRWAVKVHRSITHTLKLNERALASWFRFKDRFSPMDPLIDFFLFQLPPTTSPRSAAAIEAFVKGTELGERFALEARNIEWFSDEWISWATRLGVTWVSIDSPDFPLDVHRTDGSVYLRMHGRSGWYSHLYSEDELLEVGDRILTANPKLAYVFFNNDHGMLTNSRRMLTLLREST